MWESQGLVSNRPAEHLSYSDRGVVMFRNQMFENIERVQRGEDPLAVFRDPDHPMIDTNLDHAMSHRKPLGINTPTYEVAGREDSSEVWVDGMRVRGWRRGGLDVPDQRRRLAHQERPRGVGRQLRAD